MELLFSLRPLARPVPLLLLVLAFPGPAGRGAEAALDPAAADAGAMLTAGAPAAEVGSWAQLVAGTGPGRRVGHSAIYDPVRDRIVVFGGWQPCVANYNDVWALSLAGTPVWTKLTPGGTPPVTRYSHSAIYDPVRDRMLVFGGYSYSQGDLNDVWSLSLADPPTWTRLTPTGASPFPRDGHAAIYDPRRDRMVIFGGIFGRVRRMDTWALSLDGAPAWTYLESTGPVPDERVGPSAIYDPIRDRMVVFGGDHDTDWLRNDVRALSLAGSPAWTALSPGGTPPAPRSDHSAIYDPMRDRMVVFGGHNAQRYLYDDVWALALSDTVAWSALAPGGAPPSPRDNRSAVYDPVRDRMAVYGGAASPVYCGVGLDDLWALSLGGPVTDVLAALVSADATPERVRLEWALGSGAGLSAGVCRRTDSSPWQTLATVGADGTGRIRYEDATVTPGERYGYRLGVEGGEPGVFSGETWVDVPLAVTFALGGARPNPATRGGLWVRFALPTAEPATLELYDVGGRRVDSRGVGAMGAGEHQVRLGSAEPLSPGVYLLRLTQGTRSLTARTVLVR